MLQIETLLYCVVGRFYAIVVKIIQIKINIIYIIKIICCIFAPTITLK